MRRDADPFSLGHILKSQRDLPEELHGRSPGRPEEDQTFHVRGSPFFSLASFVWLWGAQCAPASHPALAGALSQRSPPSGHNLDMPDVAGGTRGITRTSTTLLCNRSPKTVTPAHTHGSPLLCFLPHSPLHLCYDALAYEHGGRVPGREEMGWTLSRWWTR